MLWEWKGELKEEGGGGGESILGLGTVGTATADRARRTGA